jgi:prepilin-type N-terminal cleavage/methylation domain-containing protein
MSRFKLVSKRKKGFTLIELIVAISLTSIMAGVVIVIFKTSLDTYQYVHESVIVDKISTDILDDIIDGSYQSYGIKDALEIVQASRASMAFVPLWIDDEYFFDSLKGPAQEFILRQPFKPGASIPVAEIFIQGDERSIWQAYPINFYFDEKRSGGRSRDTVSFFADPPQGKEVRFVYHPDPDACDGCVMSVGFQDEKVVRGYKKRQKFIPQHLPKGVTLTELTFQYYDNTNTEILPKRKGAVLSSDELSLVSAVRVSLGVRYQGFEKTSRAFINLRNLSVANNGIIIREGTKFKIPDSKEIRAFSLLNIINVRDGGKIVLEARSSKGQSWRFTAEFSAQEEAQVIKRYQVEYPIGQNVLTRNAQHPVSEAFSLLTFDITGKYDYDLEQLDESRVNLEGDVELTVTRMDAAGASLLIRP